MSNNQVVSDSLDYFCKMIDEFTAITKQPVCKLMSDMGIVIGKQDVYVNNVSFLDKLSPQKDSKTREMIDIRNFKLMLQEVHDVSSLSLNHLGVGYYTNSLELEQARLLKLTNDSLYIESSGINAKWFFTGNVEKIDTPLFEFVVNETKKLAMSSWTPHLQFDFDTSLTIKEVEELTVKYFGKNWIKWRIESPDYGTPLVMGKMYNIAGVKVYLGIGTNDRNRAWHRSVGLTKIKPAQASI